MDGRDTLQHSAMCASMAAEIYPAVLSWLNQAGVPPDDRSLVIFYVYQVLTIPDVCEHRVLN